MCWSFEASVAAAVVGIPPLLYLWHRDWKYDRAMAFFFLVIISMQIIEAILWKNTECNKTNDVASKIAIVQNFLQPYAMVIALFFLVKGFKPDEFAYLVAGLYLALFTGLMIWYVVQNSVFSNTYCSLPSCNGYCNMRWQWTEWETDSCKIIWPVHVMWLLLPLLVLRNLDGLIFSSIAGLLLLLGNVVTKRVGERGSAASMWCWFAAGIPIFYICLTTYLKGPK